MTTEDIDRLMNIVSEPYVRLNWELNKNNKVSLRELQKSRRYAVNSIRILDKKIVLWKNVNLVAIFSMIGLLLFCVVRFVTTDDIKSFKIILLLLAIPVVTFVLFSFYRICILTKEQKHLHETIRQCDDVFYELYLSVDALCPPGIGVNSKNKPLTEHEVTERLIRLAIMKLNAKENLWKCLIQSVTSNHVPTRDILHMATILEEYGTWFDTTWTVATNDFGFSLIKADIFKTATARLARSKNEKVQSS